MLVQCAWSGGKAANAAGREPTILRTSSTAFVKIRARLTGDLVPLIELIPLVRVKKPMLSS